MIPIICQPEMTGSAPVWPTMPHLDVALCFLLGALGLEGRVGCMGSVPILHRYVARQYYQCLH